MSELEIDNRVGAAWRSFVAQHPVAVLLVGGTIFVWISQMASLVAGVEAAQRPPSWVNSLSC